MAEEDGRELLNKFKEKDGKFQCGLCNKLLVTKTGIKKHIASIHGKPVSIKCVLAACGRSFSSVDGMARHANKVHGEGSSVCPHEFCTFETDDCMK